MTIKLAQQSDVDYMMKWLEAEYRVNGVGFFCNASVIQSHFDNKLLYIFLDESKLAVGFITGPTAGPDILAVREDRQKQGIGSQLAEFMINKARDDNICVMHIQCEPETSVPFWRKMGFEIIDSQSNVQTYASMTLERTLLIPDGEEVPVSIKFYPNGKQDGENVAPLLEANPRAVREDDVLSLAERVIFNRAAFETSGTGDTVLSVCVDGKEIYCDKAKYRTAEEIGVERQGCLAFYIDQIWHREKV